MKTFDKETNQWKMQNFEHSPAPDGIHDTVAFNEYRSPRWWSARRHREWLLDRVAPWLFAAMLFGAFAFAGWVDCAW